MGTLWDSTVYVSNGNCQGIGNFKYELIDELIIDYNDMRISIFVKYLAQHQQVLFYILLY